MPTLMISFLECIVACRPFGLCRGQELGYYPLGMLPDDAFEPDGFEPFGEGGAAAAAAEAMAAAEALGEGNILPAVDEGFGAGATFFPQIQAAKGAGGGKGKDTGKGQKAGGGQGGGGPGGGGPGG